MIKVVSIEFSGWMVEGAEGARVLGEFQSQDEALTGVWMDLVRQRQHRAYLLLEQHRLSWGGWHPPRSIFWGAVHDGMPTIYREHLDRYSARRILKLYKG